MGIFVIPINLALLRTDLESFAISPFMTKIFSIHMTSKQKRNRILLTKINLSMMQNYLFQRWLIFSKNILLSIQKHFSVMPHLIMLIFIRICCPAILLVRTDIFQKPTFCLIQSLVLKIQTIH